MRSFGFCPNYLLPPLNPIWTTCTTFFRRRNPRFESQFFSQDTFPKKVVKLLMTNPHQEPVNLEEGAWTSTQQNMLSRSVEGRRRASLPWSRRRHSTWKWVLNLSANLKNPICFCQPNSQVENEAESEMELCGRCHLPTHKYLRFFYNCSLTPACI